LRSFRRPAKNSPKKSVLMKKLSLSFQWHEDDDDAGIACYRDIYDERENIKAHRYMWL
jgi:hypothetical protein